MSADTGGGFRRCLRPQLRRRLRPGAAAQGAPFRRIVLYEPPAPEAVPAAVLSRLEALLAESRDEEALRFFLVDVVGRAPQDVEALRGRPGWARRLAALRTLPRETAALQTLDLPVKARQVEQPALLVLGGASPPWAASVLEPLSQALPDNLWLCLPGQGHMAIDMAPDVLSREVLAFLN